MTNQLVFFISTIGWFNGLLLSCYFLFIYKHRKLSGLMFGLMLLALSLRVAKSVIWWFNPKLPVIIIQAGLVACLFIGPLLLFFLKASADGLKQMPRPWKHILLSYGLVSMVLLVFFSDRVYLPYWKNYIVPFIYLHWFVYVVAAGWLVRGHFVSFLKSRASLKPNGKWVLAVYTASLLIVTTYILSFLKLKLTYIAGPICFSLLLYLNALILLYRKRTDDLFQSEPEKYANKKLDTQLADDHIRKLNQLMEEQQVFTDPDLSLAALARRLGITPHQLSQLLNDHLKRNFNAYINEHRIRKACEIMATDRTLKLEAVGYEVGFNSKSAFFSAFKKLTGKTPNLYKLELAVPSI